MKNVNNSIYGLRYPYMSIQNNTLNKYGLMSITARG